MSADFWEVVSRRRSIRRYASREVPAPVVERILRAAALAPSAHDEQPWRFVVVAPGPARQRLLERMAERYDRDMRERGIPEESRALKTQRSNHRWAAAPVLIVACLQQAPRRAPGTAIGNPDPETVMGTQGVAAAVGTLLLAATASGLGSCWYSAPLYCPQVVREALGTDPSWEPQALVTLGYPDESPAPKATKPIEEIVAHA